MEKRSASAKDGSDNKPKVLSESEINSLSEEI